MTVAAQCKNEQIRKIVADAQAHQAGTDRHHSLSYQTLLFTFPFIRIGGQHAAPSDENEEVVIIRSIDSIPSSVGTFTKTKQKKKKKQKTQFFVAVKLLRENGITASAITEEQLPVLTRVLASHDRDRDYYYMPGNEEIRRRAYKPYLFYRC